MNDLTPESYVARQVLRVQLLQKVTHDTDEFQKFIWQRLKQVGTLVLNKLSEEPIEWAVFESRARRIYNQENLVAIKARKAKYAENI